MSVRHLSAGAGSGAGHQMPVTRATVAVDAAVVKPAMPATPSPLKSWQRPGFVGVGAPRHTTSPQPLSPMLQRELFREATTGGDDAMGSSDDSKSVGAGRRHNHDDDANRNDDASHNDSHSQNDNHNHNHHHSSRTLGNSQHNRHGGHVGSSAAPQTKTGTVGLEGKVGRSLDTAGHPGHPRPTSFVSPARTNPPTSTSTSTPLLSPPKTWASMSLANTLSPSVTSAKTPSANERPVSPALRGVSSQTSGGDSGSSSARGASSPPSSSLSGACCAKVSTQLAEQKKVNAELKRLLVASVGEDTAEHIASVTEQVTHLAFSLNATQTELEETQEALDRATIDCDVWQTKFAGAKVWIGELNAWKEASESSQRLTQDALEELLAERSHLQQLLQSAVHRLGTTQQQASELPVSESVVALAERVCLMVGAQPSRAKLPPSGAMPQDGTLASLRLGSVPSPLSPPAHRLPAPRSPTIARRKAQEPALSVFAFGCCHCHGVVKHL